MKNNLIHMTLMISLELADQSVSLLGPITTWQITSGRAKRKAVLVNKYESFFTVKEANKEINRIYNIAPLFTEEN